MEFHDVGKHCSAENCGQQDFLPFRCDACSGIFCLDHRTHTGHSCTSANIKDRRVLECSKCNKVLRRPAGVDHDLLLQRHLASGCVDGVRKARPNKIGCSVQGCRGSEFVKVSCGTCRRNFCFRHRHEEDHKCQASAESSRREHHNLRRRVPFGSGAEGKASRAADEALGRVTRKQGTDGAAGGGDGTPCGTQAGEAAARREREARAARGGAGVAAR